MSTTDHVPLDGRPESQQQGVTPSTLNQRWMLHPRVSLRPEPFGALAYHYDNRKLQFLRSPDLVTVVTSMSNFESPRTAFDDHGVDARRWPNFEKALLALAASNFIQPATATSSPTATDTDTDTDNTGH